VDADRCAELGVARALDVIAATPVDIRDAVAELDGLRPAAARLREEITRLPGPERAVGLLEAYA
jgi:UDP:flavonoid glycosyltransferase YjiC (YdhE family)